MDKKTQEFIKKAESVHGKRYSYDKCVYINANEKVCITCDKHGDFFMRAVNHLKGQGCPKCAGRGLTQEEVIERFKEVHGDEYDYSKVEFTKMHDKVCIVCKTHGEFWQTPAKHIKHKQGCPKCGRIKLNKNRRITIEKFIKRANIIHEFKYDYSNVRFSNLHDKIEIICPIHGKFTQLAYDHLNGHGCPQCAIEESKIKLEDFIKRANEIHNFKYDYSKVELDGANKKVEITCPKHGSFFQNSCTHLKGCGCPKCGRLISKAENEIYEYICSLIGKENVEHNNRTLLNNREIDIYIPSLKLGIEYNGVLWHSEKYGKDSHYHVDKLEKCNELGIKLIQIFEDEYFEHKEIVLEKLRHILKKCEDKKKISARKCVVSEIKTDEAKKFLNENHIQGFGKSTVYLGLYQIFDINKKWFIRKLVGVMSFKRLKKDSNDWELVRFATDNNFIVIGGGGKLFKHFIKKYKSEYIKSFADRRWTIDGNDNLYTKIGFELSGVTKPDYRYIIGGEPERMHKFNFRKKLLNKRYGLPLEMTESEMCDKIGAYKVWDCGLFKYEWHNKDNKSVQ